MTVNAVERWTFLDAVDHLADVFDIDQGSRPYRSAIRSVVNAYRELPNKSKWSYYIRRGQLSTVDEYSTGTIVYDHTGGTNEREVTLTGGTWPSWAKFAQISFNTTRYTVEARKSDTVVTLTEDHNPQADVASGTSYNMSRAVYPLPVDAIKLSHLIEIDTGYYIELVPESALLEYLVANYTPTRPRVATVRNTGEYPFRMGIELAPPPTEAKQYDYFYEARPRKLSVLDYNTGTVSITSGATTLTGSGTTWTSDMVGSVVRLSSDGTTLPTSIIGRDIAGTHTRNPAVFESVIDSFTSTTSVELKDAADATYSAVKYQISDPVDLESGSMFEYFLRLCEVKFVRSHRNASEGERQEMEVAARQSLREAMAADARHNFDVYEPGTRWYTLEDWAN